MGISFDRNRDSFGTNDNSIGKNCKILPTKMPNPSEGIGKTIGTKRQFLRKEISFSSEDFAVVTKSFFAHESVKSVGEMTLGEEDAHTPIKRAEGRVGK